MSPVVGSEGSQSRWSHLHQVWDGAQACGIPPRGTISSGQQYRGGYGPNVNTLNGVRAQIGLLSELFHYEFREAGVCPLTTGETKVIG